MEMNDKTILRIKVPAHLYESVKAQLTLKEASAPIHTVTTMDGKTVVGTHQYGVGFKANENGKKMGFKDDPKSIPNGTKMDKGDLNEAKGKRVYGAGMEEVKQPKTTKTPKTKPAANAPQNATGAMFDKETEKMGAGVSETKKMGLDEFKALYELLGNKIQEMEGANKEENQSEENIEEINKEDDSKKKVKEARDFSGYLKGSEISNAAAAIDIIDAAIEKRQDVKFTEKVDGEEIVKTVIETYPQFYSIIIGTKEDPVAKKLTKPENLSAITIDGKSIEDQIAAALALMPKITAADYVTPKEIPLSSRFD